MIWERLMHEGEIDVGDRVHLPEQARALRLIAEHGADAFYHGPIADAIIASVEADGGVISREDLTGYAVQEVEPIVHDAGGARVLAMPPPSSGGVAVAQILDLAERLDLAMPPTGSPDTDAVHALAEIMKHAFADRSRHMADPAFHDVPVDAMLDAERLDATAQAVRRAVTLRRTGSPDSYGIADPIEEDGGTSHISVIDRWGSAVACTETINLAFGSLVGVEGFGFCLNNQMDDFTTIKGQANAFGLVQSEANLSEPGKRPLSSMSPTIIVDERGEVIAVAGASGGPRIISSTAQVLLRRLRGNATAEQAVAAPRLHHQWLPDFLFLEPCNESSLAESLGERGFTSAERERIGAVQAIFRDPDSQRVDGSADPRKGGGVAGDAE
jgi:gamma-glutamyltranspeptidase/glutathione hydrolase